MQKLKKAYLEITNLCNLACAFCPGTKRAGGILSPPQFQLLAGRLRPHTDHLHLHLMGEPLLHPQLGQLLSLAAQLGFWVDITTNGTLLPKQASLLCASPALRKVSVSLHSFEGNEGGGPLGSYLTDCLAFAQQAALAGKLCALRLWNLDGETTQGIRAHNPAILAQLEAAFPLPWKEGRQGITLAPRIFLEWGQRFDWPDLAAPASDKGGFCHGLRQQVGVLVDGTVVPCCLDHEGDIPLGNLFDQPLEEILATPRAKALYDGFSCRRPAEELCRRCGYMRRFG